MRTLFACLFFIPILLSAQIPAIDDSLNQMGDKVETVDWLNDTLKVFPRADLAALEYYAKYSIELARQLEYKQGEAQALGYLGISYWGRDRHQEAMEQYLEALRLFREIGDQARSARVLVNIGNTYDELGQTDKAMEYVQEAIDILTELDDQKRLSQAQLNLGVIFFYQEAYDSSLFYFEEVMKFRIQGQDTAGIALLNLNIANVYEFKKDITTAADYYLKALNMVKPEDLLRANIYLGLGNAYLLTGRDVAGLKYLDSGLNMAVETEQAYMQQVAVSYFKEHYLRQNEFEKAYEYLEQEYELDDQIRGEKVQEQVEVLTLKFEDEKKAKQLAELETEKAQQRLFFIAIVLTSVLLLSLAIFIVLTLRNRERVAKKQSVLLQERLDQKSKELASYALNFIQKNELLGELSDKVNELKDISNDKMHRGLNQLNNIIGGSMRIDQDWETFRLMFEEVHSGFLMRLKEEHMDLGNADLKLCALLRLNMNLKESSRILGISADSVKTARSRLRKKLGLKTEENLVDFLISFDNRSKTLETLHYN
ncbi:MAG: tetratricopeptide repeat protein [Cytophagales bacterium]|nr:tetratricopeptide repeat protein [Cytophagales bacterium]